ncbi:reverse transcriptase [Gossypium australe]|uniref:Reverse transcriptase n=1 Tax=Gossypium australe TaxID=47621 RepID=A0A5B6UT62_9ROSI|nr:reverse transcriptase [Gossypium australe]
MLVTAPKHKVDVLKPKKFMGMRSARYVDNFLWGMEKYFCAKGIMNDATMVNIVAVYFTNVALLWYHCKSTDERQSGTVIETWEEFQSGFKVQFYLEYVEDDARAKLRRLTQQGIIRGYNVEGLKRRAIVGETIRKWDRPQRSMLSTIVKKDEAEPNEEKMLRLGSMIFNPAKVKRVDTGASDLFIKVQIVGVPQGLELQISEWKGKEDFEVLLAIKLAEDVHSGKNIDSVDRVSVAKTPLEMLKV